jgi:hypothetical protein
MNLDGSCGLTGPRWSFDKDAHYNWCLTVPETVSDAESRARSQLLDHCRGGSLAPPPVPELEQERRARCKQYAHRAMRQVRQNVDWKCGFTGPRWSADPNAHLNWCLRTPGVNPDAEIAARDRRVKEQCSLLAYRRRVCGDYAQRAMDLVGHNNQRRCGFTGPRWRLDYDWHYNWCLKPESNFMAEQQVREDMYRDACP